ncbi:hypothetical protein GCM10010483_53840 [Actinokineospora diospyrosa]
MRELSDESGVPVATIKYYLREGLLAPGERTAPNQATYATAHLDRLRLVRALVDLGGLSIEAVRAVLAAVDDRSPLPEVLTAAHRRFPGVRAATGDDHAWAMTRVDHLARTRGWRVDPGDELTDALVTLLCALRATGLPTRLSTVEAYAAVAEALATLDLDVLDDPDAPRWAPALVTTLGDPLVALLRALALRNSALALRNTHDAQHVIGEHRPHLAREPVPQAVDEH